MTIYYIILLDKENQRKLNRKIKGKIKDKLYLRWYLENRDYE